MMSINLDTFSLDSIINLLQKRINPEEIRWLYSTKGTAIPAETAVPFIQNGEVNFPPGMPINRLKE